MVAQSKSRVAASTSEEAAAAATVLQLRARDSRFDGNLVGEMLFRRRGGGVCTNFGSLPPVRRGSSSRDDGCFDRMRAVLRFARRSCGKGSS